MITDDFINLLARDARVRPVRAVQLWLPVAIALALSAVLMAVTVGIRDDLLLLTHSPLFWFKLAFLGSITIVGWRAVLAVSTPGATGEYLRLALTLALLALAVVAVVMVLQADAVVRPQLLWGTTWKWCSIIIAAMSMPMYLATLRLMRRRAPTHLRLAGADAGFSSGAAAALIYCLHCPELAPSFVGVWYIIGICIPTAAGALMGRNMLAW